MDLRDEMMHIHHHALLRYREQHPIASYEDISTAIETGTSESPEYIAILTGRHKPDYGTSYVVPTDAMGVFVIAQDTVITYLRFSPAQRDVFLGGSPKTQAPSLSVAGVPIECVHALEQVIKFYGSLDKVRTAVTGASFVEEIPEGKVLLAGKVKLVAKPSSSGKEVHLWFYKDVIARRHVQKKSATDKYLESLEAKYKDWHS